MRGRIPVVVQARGRRSGVGRALWASAEVFVTCGVLLVLLVVHQLWWTNEQARAEAGRQVRRLEGEWDRSPHPGGADDAGGSGEALDGGDGGEGVDGVEGVGGGEGGGGPGGGGSGMGDSGGGGEGRAPGAAAEGSSAYAVLRIPRLGLTVPVAPGVGKRSVLDRGFAGHYPGTASPGRVGNFALAGHRNTHGEPFRYINRLRKGDLVTVRTRGGTYTYRVDLVLPQTSPRDTGVIAPVPRSLVKPRYGYDQPGAYLTLTTCTPEFTSTYRLVVWAKLVADRSRG
ncbi:class E sortase [Streptomyces sp. NPDC057411]|uniref:class E sortase n=1 Tax=unclassified Streptomyces TaxID=2593676 RepID=UPI00363BFB84